MAEDEMVGWHHQLDEHEFQHSGGWETAAYESPKNNQYSQNNYANQKIILKGHIKGKFP